MFESFGSMQEAFSSSPGDGEAPRPNYRRARRRKSIREVVSFWGLNIIVLPFVLICYETVGAEGLRQTMSVFQTRFYRLPLPGAGLLREYDGFNRLDLALPMAFVLFIAVTLLWVRVFKSLQNYGELDLQRKHNPILFYLVAAMVAIIVLGDAAIFYAGLSSTVASSWTEESSGSTALVATVIYSAGLALLGAWHADYHRIEPL